MMEHAGRGLAEVVRQQFDDLEAKSVLGLVGTGNNGGDTLVALSYLAGWGWQASAYLVKARPEDDALVERARQAGVTIVSGVEDKGRKKLAAALEHHAVLLDGVLGTGVRLPLRGEAAEVLDFVRRACEQMERPPVVVAVDCPSGVDCDTGEAAAEAIPADLTVTMAAVKQGLLKFPAYRLEGEVHLVGIGLPDGLKAYEKVRREVVFEEWVAAVLPPRPLEAHKGTFGTALVVAGSINFVGAAALAGEAAYRVGAGLVTLGTVLPVQQALAGRLPEVTWLPLPHQDGYIAEDAAEVVRDNLKRVTALLVGPGLGQEETTGEFLRQLLGGEARAASGRVGFVPLTVERKSAAETTPALPPLVVDADGLKLLVGIEHWWQKLPAPAVLTPHPGEMAVLCGLDKEAIQADRVGVAERYAAEWGHVVVLKGAFTVIASPDGRTAVIPVASPALARAGTGDVLAGIIVGLRAQGVDAFEAAAAGAWLHAQAGLLAEEMHGNSAAVMAGDLLVTLPAVLGRLG
ncbi:MAG: NAD(P)H-hydrate dehydratase [Anaerolineae bacterium]|nr:MAG: NAD(P)H-hydrate dehydratase [Anaerolineae bacterium]